MGRKNCDREEADRRERDDKIRLAAEAAFNKRLYDRIKGYVFRFVFAAMGFGIGISLLIAALYLDPQQERTSQRLLAALLSVVLGTFFGAAMLFVVDFLPQLRHRWWQAAAAAALGWLACDMGLLMLVYIYYSEPLLKWLPFTTLVIVSGFALPSLLKVQIGWRLIAGIGAVFLALFFPWLIDSATRPDCLPVRLGRHFGASMPVDGDFLHGRNLFARDRAVVPHRSISRGEVCSNQRVRGNTQC